MINSDFLRAAEIVTKAIIKKHSKLEGVNLQSKSIKVFFALLSGKNAKNVSDVGKKYFRIAVTALQEKEIDPRQMEIVYQEMLKGEKTTVVFLWSEINRKVTEFVPVKKFRELLVVA